MGSPNYQIDSIQLNYHCLDKPWPHRPDECQAQVKFHQEGSPEQFTQEYGRQGDAFVKLENKGACLWDPPNLKSYLKYALSFDQQIDEFQNYGRYVIDYYHGSSMKDILRLTGAIRDFVNFGSLESTDPIHTRDKKNLSKLIRDANVIQLESAKFSLDSFRDLKSTQAAEKIRWIEKQIAGVLPKKIAQEKAEQSRDEAYYRAKECEHDGFGVASTGIHFGGGMVGSTFGRTPEGEPDTTRGHYGEVGAFARLFPLPFTDRCYDGSSSSWEINYFSLSGGATYFYHGVKDRSIQGIRPNLRVQYLPLHFGGGPIWGRRTRTHQPIRGFNVHGGLSLPIILGQKDHFGLIPDIFTFNYDSYRDPVSRERGQHVSVSAYNAAAAGLFVVGAIIYWLSEGAPYM